MRFGTATALILTLLGQLVNVVAGSALRGNVDYNAPIIPGSTCTRNHLANAIRLLARNRFDEARVFITYASKVVDLDVWNDVMDNMSDDLEVSSDEMQVIRFIVRGFVYEGQRGVPSYHGLVSGFESESDWTTLPPNAGPFEEAEYARLVASVSSALAPTTPGQWWPWWS